MADQKINHLKISCLEILDNKEQKRGGKFVSILCSVRGADPFAENGRAVLLPSGLPLTVRKVERTGKGNECVAVLKGIHRKELRRRNLIVPDSYAASSGKEAFFLLPSSKDRMEKGGFFVEGGVFPEYNGGSDKPSAALTFHGRIASVRFFHPFPLVVGARYYISSEHNRDLRTPVTLVYAGKLTGKEGELLSDRLLKYGGRPSLRALYSIILRMNKAVRLPSYMNSEEFEGSVRSGEWAVMSREYDRIKGALLKRSASFGGVPAGELARHVNGDADLVRRIISELIEKGELDRREGYILNMNRSAESSLSPIAAKLLSDIETEEDVTLSNISNPLIAETYRALGRMDLVRILKGEIIVSRKRFESLKRTLLDSLSPDGEFDLNVAKEILPLSRRVLVPFLEELDDEGYFEHREDKRVVLKKD